MAAKASPLADEERSPLSTVLDLLSTDEQRRTRIAWLYYVEGLTQAEIALRMGVSRVKVIRDLQVGRQTGLVQIQINGRLAPCVALERRLEKAFALKEAVVVPTPQDPAHLPATLGIALGSWLSDRLRPGQTIAVGWGRTLHWSVRALRRRDLPDLTVVALLGGIGRGSEINMYETAARVAETLGAQCYYLAAPAFTASAAMRDMLLAQAGLHDVLDRARRADIALVSVGTLGPGATNRRIGLLGEAETQELLAAGAVGDLLCTFLDREGRPVDHPLNRCSVGLPVPDLAALPAAVLASGGAEKVAVIRAALVGGYVNHLITDEATARALAA
ncbi:MAG: sugar-binding transcriptional regulator [Geminicoccaceae bacterium]